MPLATRLQQFIAAVTVLGVSALLGAAPGEAAPVSPASIEVSASTEDEDLRAVIRRTSNGLPHIVADDYASLGFGHGYATAETNACVLADTLVTARGERSRWFGPEARYSDQVTLDATNLQTDALFTDLRNRKVVERLLADPQRGPSAQVKAMVRGYVAGLNQHLRDVGGADGIDDPACAGEPWVQPATELDLWYGVYAANLLASSGVFVPEIVQAAPPTAQDPGLPQGTTAQNSAQPDAQPDARFAPVPAEVPTRDQLRTRLGKDPSGFGSNATALGAQATSTGRGMLLGNPHFPWRGRYRFSQMHLTIPGEYDVAGAGLIGSPVVNIGWNNDVAWSHTVSTAYRFTPYEYRTVPGSPTTYLTTEGPRELERRQVEIAVRGGDGRVHTVTEDLYRTDEGYVVDAPEVLMGWTPASVFALRDANAEHLRTVDVFHEMAKTHSVGELLAAQDRTAGMPWVNTIAADRHGDALYADHSVVPNVPDDLVQQCATPIGHALFELAGLPALDGTRASGDCAWRNDTDASRTGIFGPANLPQTVRRDWVMNANDSYWLPNPRERLEGFDRIIGCERCERSLRSRMVYTYVLDRLAGADRLGPGGSMSHAQLQAVEHENRVYGAELAREGDDLQEVCQAAAGGTACEALARWDGRTDIDSEGAHLFREFFLRLPAQLRWEVPFDPARPMQTPRDLNEKNPQVVAAMEDAVAYLQEQHVPFDASLGDLQVAGDDGAPPIPVGGGEHATGNANVVTSRDAGANLDRLYPISYGSSHIQAVAFTDAGVDAATILTYGLASDPTSPYSHAQTELFSSERWVNFPFSPEEIRQDPRFHRYVVRNSG